MPAMAPRLQPFSPRSPVLRRQLSVAMASVPVQVTKSNYLAIAVLCATALLLVAFRSGPASLSAMSLSLPGSPRGDIRREFMVYSKILRPTREVVNGTEFVYQVPAKPRAVMFLAHGCNCKSTFFWDKHPDCETCSGAPEERAFVIKALRASYAVIAITSRGYCWRKEDSGRVKFILEDWIDRFDLVELPLLGLGASSGGYFISSLAQVMRFDAIVVMIAEGRFHIIPNSTYPPVLFVHMVKDETRAEKIREIIPVFRKAGIVADEIQCKELKITDNFFSKRISYIDLEMSVKLRELFEQSGHLDERGYLKTEPRSLKLKLEMRRNGGQELVDSLSWKADNWEHHIQEELNLAFAFHEFTSLPTRKVITWLESHVNMPPNTTAASLSL